MNLKIALEMFREQFQRSLPILAISLGLSTALCLVQYVSLPWNRPEASFMGFTMFVAHAGGIFGLLYCHSDDRDMQVTMPAYLLRLPIRTIDLVILRMGYGLLFVASIGIWNSAIHYPLFSIQGDPSFGFWTPCLIGITTYALFQAFSWSFGGLGIIILICANPTIVMLSFLFGFEIHPHESFDPSRYAAEAVLAALAVSFLIAYVGVRTRRSARIDVDRILIALPALFSEAHRARRPPFTSPEQAMRWLEWRRQSRLLPLLVCVGSVVFVLFIIRISQELGFQPSSHAAYGESVVAASYFALAFAALAFGAYCFFHNQRLQVGPLKTFLFIRPVSTKQISQARMVVVLRSAAISMVPFLLVCAATVLLAVGNTDPSNISSIVNEHMDLGGVGMALLMLTGVFAIIWCYQWFGNLLALVFVLVIASLVGQILLFFLDVHASRQEAFIMACAFWMTACASFAGGAYAFYRAIQGDLVDKKSLYVALAAWPLLVVGFALSLNPSRYLHGGGIFELALHDIGPMLTFAFLPIMPLATVPLVMQYARHR